MVEGELGGVGLVGADGDRADLEWVALDSADAAAHDHARRVGSHSAAVTSIETAQEAGRTVCVRTVVTRSNLQGLAPLGAWLAERGVAAWSLELARTDDIEHARRLLPSIGLAAPRVLHALASARGRGVEPFVVGFPLCVLGPYAPWSVSAEPGEGAHAAPCEECPARVSCSGLSPLHRDRFGVRELRRLPVPVGPERTPRRVFLTPLPSAIKTIVD